MSESALQRYMRLETECQKAREQARAEALAKAQHGVDELNRLGFSFELRERKPKARRNAGKQRPQEETTPGDDT